MLHCEIQHLYNIMQVYCPDESNSDALLTLPSRESHLTPSPFGRRFPGGLTTLRLSPLSVSSVLSLRVPAWHHSTSGTGVAHSCETCRGKRGGEYHLKARNTKRCPKENTGNKKYWLCCLLLTEELVHI